MNTVDFLRRWFAIQKQRVQLRRLRKEIIALMAEADQLKAEIDDMRCIHCGKKKCG